MKQWLKDHFIPHEGNEHQPHFFRFKIVGGILALAFLVEALYLVQAFVVLPKSGYFAAIFASVLVDQTNEKRFANELTTLTVNPVLEQAARMKAQDMATRGYFAHNSPDGKEPWYWFEKAGYDYIAAGENLAVNFTDSKDVTDAWMHSPTHRANILSGGYAEIGIATAQGTYKGREAIFVVQLFGKPFPVIKEKQGIPLPAISIEPEATQKPVVLKVAKPQPAAKISEAPAASREKATTTPPAEASNAVAGAEVIKADETLPLASVRSAETRWVHIAASPRKTLDVIYVALITFILFALCLAVFIKIRIQHPHVIINALFLVFFLSSLIMLNASIVLSRGVI